MEKSNVHHVDHNQREDLLHSDTLAGTGPNETVDPAGYEESINPVGEVPTGGDASTPAGEDAPIAERVGRDPSNLGEDIPDQGDIVHPAPVNAPVGKAPAM